MPRRKTRSSLRRRALTLSCVAGGLLVLASVPVSSMAAEAGSDPLAFAPPPSYRSYRVMDLSARTSLGTTAIKLGAGDWLIKLPTDHPINAPVGLQVTLRSATDRPHDVVIIGGEVRVTGNDSTRVERSAYLNSWTGTFFLEGVHFTSIDGNLGEGIDAHASAPGATLVLQNIQIDLLHGSAAGHHADALQVWNGPYNLRVDGFEAATQYQGMFLLPDQQYTGSYPAGGVYDLRRVHLDSTTATGYALWRNASTTLRTDQVFVDAAAARVSSGTVRWSSALWPDVQVNVPHGSVLTGTPGYGYVSPGYR